jgi:hypothetical protein
MKKTKLARITFKRQKPSRAFAPQIYHANRAGERIATIQENSREEGTFFWYGRPGGEHVNTAGKAATLEECKADIIQRFTMITT